MRYGEQVGGYVNDDWMTLGQAEEYLARKYGLTWSRPYWRKLIRKGVLVGRQPYPRGWWVVSRRSVDDYFARR